MDSFLSKCGANNSQDKSLVLRELRGPFEIAVWSLVMHFSRPRRKARLAEDRVRATELPRCKAIDQPCAEKSAAAFRQGSKMRRPSNWGCLQWLQPNQTFSSPLFFFGRNFFAASQVGWLEVLDFRLGGYFNDRQRRQHHDGLQVAYSQALCAKGTLPAPGPSRWARPTHNRRGARSETGLQEAQAVGALCCH